MEYGLSGQPFQVLSHEPPCLCQVDNLVQALPLTALTASQNGTVISTQPVMLLPAHIIRMPRRLTSPTDGSSELSN